MSRANASPTCLARDVVPAATAIAYRRVSNQVEAPGVRQIRSRQGREPGAFPRRVAFHIAQHTWPDQRWKRVRRVEALHWRGQGKGARASTTSGPASASSSRAAVGQKCDSDSKVPLASGRISGENAGTPSAPPRFPPHVNDAQTAAVTVEEHTVVTFVASHDPAAGGMLTRCRG